MYFWGLLLLFVLISSFHYFILFSTLGKNSIFGNKTKVSVSSVISLMYPFFSQQAAGQAAALPNHSVLGQM